MAGRSIKQRLQPRNIHHRNCREVHSSAKAVVCWEEPDRCTSTNSRGTGHGTSRKIRQQSWECPAQSDDLAVITKAMSISQYEVSWNVTGNSDEVIVPFDVGVTSDVGKDLWGVRDCAVHCRRTEIRVSAVLYRVMLCRG